MTFLVNNNFRQDKQDLLVFDEILGLFSLLFNRFILVPVKNSYIWFQPNDKEWFQ